uniref:heparinase II/III domain-containing protein n=1 Tax=Bosea sp. (in: a-proteobacteria) TaxID=1871050 RepID=UPI002FC7A996
SGEVWAFEASGLPVTLEESVFFAAADGRRRTSQLIVDFDAAATPQISWRFARLGAAGRRAAAEAEAETEAQARQADLLPPD